MRSHHDLYAPKRVSLGDDPQELYSEILPGLYQGGTDDADWIDRGAPLDRGNDPNGFDSVLTLFAWANPFGWGVQELRFGFMDAHPQHTDMTRVIQAARWAHAQWSMGRRVLIRCQAGLNRSGLLTALVLMLDGWDPADAIRHIRQQRSAIALFNEDFVDWLMTDAGAALRLDGDQAA